VVERVRALEADGAVLVQGNTDVVVADLDFTAAFPWMPEVPDSFRAAAEWAQGQLDATALDWLRRLPAERRLRFDETLVLVCHASPGSQTAGFLTDLDPSAVVEMAGRTDARVIACGHTHVPTIRDLGWKVIVNDGSCGYAFDGDPAASWSLIELDGDTVGAEIRRTAYDVDAAADAVGKRGLPGDVYRAATIRAGRLIR
jgi:diadenosine tetraphosphatase ApaH/serine/threonine PP2A family protein phosphatase